MRAKTETGCPSDIRRKESASFTRSNLSIPKTLNINKSVLVCSKRVSENTFSLNKTLLREKEQ